MQIDILFIVHDIFSVFVKNKNQFLLPSFCHEIRMQLSVAQMGKKVEKIVTLF